MNTQTPAQVEEHVRATYLAHLPLRLAQVRQLGIERRWDKLKHECEKLAHGAENHGLPDLARLAKLAVRNIPSDVDLLTYTLDEDSRMALSELVQYVQSLNP